MVTYVLFLAFTLFLALEKFFGVTSNPDRCFILELTCTLIITGLFFWKVIFILNRRINDYPRVSPELLEAECDVIAASTVMGSLHYFATRSFLGMQIMHEGWILNVLLMAYALIDSMEAQNTYLHQIAVGLCVLNSLRFTYQFFYVATKQKKHNKLVLSAMRLCEYWLPQIQTWMYIRQAKYTDPQQTYSMYALVYLTLFVFYWLYTNVGGEDGDGVQSFGITQPPHNVRKVGMLVYGQSRGIDSMLTMDASFAEEMSKMQTLLPQEAAKAPAPPSAPSTTPQVDLLSFE